MLYFSRVYQHKYKKHKGIETDKTRKRYSLKVDEVEHST